MDASTSHWHKIRSSNSDLHEALMELAAAEISGSRPVNEKTLGEVSRRKLRGSKYVADDGNKVSFREGEVREDYYAHVGAKRMAEEWVAPKRFLDVFRSLKRRFRQLDASSDLGSVALCILQRAHRKDVYERFLEIAKEAEQREDKASLIWPLYRSICEALPRLEVDATRIANSIGTIKSTLGGNVRSFHAAIQQIAADSKGEALSLAKALHRKGFKEATDALPVVLGGLAKHDFDLAYKKCLDLVHADESHRIAAGVRALGLLTPREQSPKLVESTLQEYEALRQSDDEEVLTSLITGYNSLRDCTEVASEALVNLAGSPLASVRVKLSWVLRSATRNSQELSPWIEEGLLKLSSRSSKRVETVSNLDRCACEFVRGGRVDTGLTVLRSVVENQEQETDVTDLLGQTIEELRKNHLPFLEREVTEWWLSNNVDLHRAASQIIKKYDFNVGEGEEPTFKLSEEALAEAGENEVINALIRVVAYVMPMGGRSLATLVCGGLDKPDCSKNFIEKVVYILVEYVLYSFPDSGREVLEKRAENTNSETVRNAVERALQESQQYYEALDKLPQLKELKPTDREMRQYLLAEKKWIQEVKRGAEEKSLVGDLFRKVNLKYGQAFFFAESFILFSTTSTEEIFVWRGIAQNKDH